MTTGFKTMTAKLSNDIKKRLDKAKLVSAKDLKGISDPDLAEFLGQLYASSSPLVRMTATIMNSIFCEQKPVFLFSKKILNDLLKSDKNLRRKTVSGTNYAELWSFLIGNGFFTVVRKAEKGVRVASVLELKSKGLLQEFDKRVAEHFRTLQKENCLEVFDTYLIKLQKTPRKNFTKIAVPSVLTN